MESSKTERSHNHMLAETVIYRDARGVDHAAIITEVYNLDRADLHVFGYLREGANPTRVNRGDGRGNFRDKSQVADEDLQPIEAPSEPVTEETPAQEAAEPTTEPTVEPEPTSDAEPAATE